MNYMAIYSKLITTRKRMCRVKSKAIRYDCHHIMPRCLTREKSNGKVLSDDRSSNLVLLTLKEHYLAHMLLAKIYPESKGCNKAVGFVTSIDKRNSRSYTLAMSKIREQNRTCPIRIAKTRKHIKAWNAKQTAAGTHPLKRPEAVANATATRRKQHLERKANGEYLFDVDTRQKSSDRMSKFNATPEQKQVMTSRNTEQATCEHCQVTGAKMSMLQWHWTNCLENPSNLGLNRKQIKQRKSNNAQP